MKKIDTLSDKWFVDNRYWKSTYDTSSRVGRYYNQNTNKLTEMMNELLDKPNRVTRVQFKNTYIVHLIMPEEVLAYINGHK